MATGGRVNGEGAVQTLTMMGFGVVLGTLLYGLSYVLFRRAPSP